MSLDFLWNIVRLTMLDNICFRDARKLSQLIIIPPGDPDSEKYVVDNCVVK